MPVPWIDVSDTNVVGVKINDYDQISVKKAVDFLLLKLNYEKNISPGKRIVLKPNMLTPSEPSKAICTHPAVLEALCLWFKSRGCQVTISDSPGGWINHTSQELARVYRECGYEDVAKRTGALLDTSEDWRIIEYPDGKVCRKFKVLKTHLEADAIIVVSKAKSHMLTGITCAVKNLLGVVPGAEKSRFHSRFRDPYSFAEMLLDLNGVMKPALQIVDAVLGMEGEGPNTGEPVHIGSIVSGKDPVAVDAALCRILRIDPSKIPTIEAAKARGWIAQDFHVSIEAFELHTTHTGELKTPEPGKTTESAYAEDPEPKHIPLEKLMLPKEFALPATYKITSIPFGRYIWSVYSSLLRIHDLYPLVDKSMCKACGKCIAACPQYAIEFRELRENSRFWKGLRETFLTKKVSLKKPFQKQQKQNPTLGNEITGNQKDMENESAGQNRRVIRKYVYIHREKCIKCYCCHESCNYGAIMLRKNALRYIWDSIKPFIKPALRAVLSIVKSIISAGLKTIVSIKYKTAAFLADLKQRGPEALLARLDILITHIMVGKSLTGKTPQI
ncbi:MAG: DUF362 domain-containing protein [Thermoplasmata archaeon]